MPKISAKFERCDPQWGAKCRWSYGVGLITSQLCITDSARVSLAPGSRLVLAPNQYHAAAGALACSRPCMDAAAIATLDHWVHTKTWDNPQNRKYITNATHPENDRAVTIGSCTIKQLGDFCVWGWSLEVWFLRCECGQTDRQTDTLITTSRFSTMSVKFR